MDPFDTLGLPPRFALDVCEAEKRFRDLSRTLHPDKYVGRPASERRRALSKAIEVNEAWRVLRDPSQRAQALLRRAGHDAAEPKAPPELLLEMMEQRETLSEVRASKNRESLAQLVSAMRAREKAVLGRLAAALDEPKDPIDFAAVAAIVAELRFVTRFLEEASAAEEELS